MRNYTQVDVFTATPLLGNPLAVVHAAEGLADAQMQAFARWTNLSETTFLLPPTDAAADYRVRIYTPGGELPFAGHPTLGSCHAWIEAGGVPRAGDGMVVQQCGVGLVRIRCSAGANAGTNAGAKPVDASSLASVATPARLAFAAPPLVRNEVDAATLAPVLAALGLGADEVGAAQWLDNGPRWLGLLLGSAARVLEVRPDHAALALLPKIGIVGAHLAGAECAFEVRAFAASIGVPEDPVTGSLNASLGAWLMTTGVAPDRYVAAQGACVGRAGRVHIERDGDTLWVGGDCIRCVRGTVWLDAAT